LQAIRMIDEVDGDRSDWTQPAVVERRLRIALDFNENAVAHVQQRAASAVARTANTLVDDCGLADAGFFRLVLLKRHRSCLTAKALDGRRVRESLPGI